MRIPLITIALIRFTAGLLPRFDFEAVLVLLPAATAIDHFILLLAVAVAFRAAVGILSAVLKQYATAVSQLVVLAALQPLAAAPAIPHLKAPVAIAVAFRATVGIASTVLQQNAAAVLQFVVLTAL